jgi:hypothetical protein
MGSDPIPWAIVWSIAGVIWAVSFRRGFDMTSQRRWLVSSVWYFISILPLAAVSLWWAAMSNPAPTTKWVVLGVIGAAFGATLFITVGELFKPTSAANAQVAGQSSQTSPPNAPSQTITIPGSGNILNFGSAGNITQNSEAKMRQAMRDPDGIYQLDQKVAMVVAPEIKRSESFVLFKSIQDAQLLDIKRDFQWREYVLRYIGSSDQIVVQGAGFAGRQFLNVQCSIVGIVSN